MARLYADIQLSSGGSSAQGERVLTQHHYPSSKHLSSDADLIAYMADDARKWAAEFCRALNASDHALDENWVAGWFANAIECSYDLRQRLTERAYQRAAAYGRSPSAEAMADMRAIEALDEETRARASAAFVRARLADESPEPDSSSKHLPTAAK